MRIVETALDGVLLLEIPRFEDERGWFMEVWNEGRYRDVGLGRPLVQTNVSVSIRGVLRGMHFQAPHEQAKLVSVLAGSVLDVVVDLRPGSATFTRWYGCELSAENRQQLWVPEGFAHGFLVLSDSAVVHYGCTTPYVREADRAVAWNDPDVGIAWPSEPAIVSDKDRSAPFLRDLSPDDLPRG